MKFTERIRHLRVAQGNVSEAELARRLGVKPQTLNKKMQTDNFSTEDLEQIAEALGCSFSAEFILPDGTKI